MSAIAAARQTLADVAQEGDFNAPTIETGHIDAMLDELTEAIVLPDGKVIYPAKLHGVPVHEIATALLDMQDPAASRFIRLIGPPGTGKSQIARAIAYTIWTKELGRPVSERHGQPFYGFVEMSGGPSSDEFTFKYEFVPDKDNPGDVKVVPSAFVEAMENGWVVMIDEPNIIRDIALLSLNSTLDGRLSLYLPAEGRTVVAKPGFAVIIAYNPGLVGATDIPDAWYSRFPATVEVTTNWAALAKIGADHKLVAAAKNLDAKRFDPKAGIVWTPQFREIESLTHMIERVGERAAVSLFISSLVEQIDAGKVQEAEGAAVCRMLDEAGFGELKVAAKSGIPNLHRYPRAVTR